MKVIYDGTADVLKIVFRDAPMEDYSEDRPNLTVFYDAEDTMIALEIRHASNVVDDPRSLDHVVTE